jgi:CRISPR/Cas system-associated endoribonuclease Cas2
MSKSIRTVLGVAALTLSLSGFAASAMADETQWQKDHPRRTEVNARLANQNRRINNEVKEGEISKAQAHQLHKEDHAIRREERTMASTNNGHITKAEQRSLNQQENQVSRQIGK